MNTTHPPDPTKTLEPEELETWESRDFDDLLDEFSCLEQDIELTWNDSFGWQSGLIR